MPDLSISSDGPVMSILLFSKVPVTELDGKKICLTDSSATGVALLRVLFDHYFHGEVEYVTTASDLESMLKKGDAALLIGDNAMQAHQYALENNLSCHVTDLGEAWKKFTGQQMVYALWVARLDIARDNPKAVEFFGKAMLDAKSIGLSQLPAIYEKARKRTGLPLSLMEDYFNLLEYGFGQEARKGLLTFYDYAYKSGLVDERVKLNVWGEEND
jgi:chorismate dehydratase